MTGCISAQRLSDQNRKNIQKVYFEPGHKKAKKMNYAGPVSSKVGGLLGLVTSVKPRHALEELVIANDIHIEKIATESVKQHLISSNKFEVVDSLEEADAKLRVTVLMYGFVGSHSLSMTVEPSLRIITEMFTKNEEKLWQSRGTANTQMNRTKKRRFSELKNDPSLIAESWKAGCDKMAEQTIREL